MAYGLVLLYINIGSLNYKEVAFYFSQIDKLTPIEIWAIALVLCSILYKLAIVPFHNWYAQTIKGAASVISIHFTTLSALTVICVLMKLISSPFKPIISSITPVIFFLSIISMIIGAVMSANQKNIKKLLCYSSIHHIGFVLIGVCIFNQQSMLAGVIYLFIYVFSYIFLYICLLSFRSKEGYVEYLDDLSGLSETKQYLSAAILLSLLTLIGVPPLIGYLGRFVIVNSLISAHLYWVAVIVIISVAINSYAYLKIIRVVYFSKSIKKFKDTDSNLSILLILITIVSIYFMLKPDILVNVFEPAIKRLMIG
jgi:NADH-quinone oxidoreductase subunit N